MHIENLLIASLAESVRSRLLEACEPAALVVSDVLCEPGQAMTHVYFPVEGFVSLVHPVEGHAGLEVGMVGREGMVGACWSSWPRRPPV